MTPFEELEALDRIFKVIKTFRRQKENDLALFNSDLVKSYLIAHLSSQDLQRWLRLEAQGDLSEFLCRCRS